MPFTAEELLLLMTLTRRELVVEFDGYQVTKEVRGYHPDKKMAALQAKLSIMLAAKSGGR